MSGAYICLCALWPACRTAIRVARIAPAGALASGPLPRPPALLGLVAATTGAFSAVDAAAGKLMAPYLAFTAFANALNYGVIKMNPEEVREDGAAVRAEAMRPAVSVQGGKQGEGHGAGGVDAVSRLPPGQCIPHPTPPHPNPPHPTPPQPNPPQPNPTQPTGRRRSGRAAEAEGGASVGRRDKRRCLGGPGRSGLGQFVTCCERRGACGRRPAPLVLNCNTKLFGAQKSVYSPKPRERSGSATSSVPPAARISGRKGR
jgi:hypothetical protein